MNCKQVEELLPLYAGRELEEKRATLVTEHLQTCVACAHVADEYCESVRLTQQFAPPVLSEALYLGMRQRVLREIETEARAPVWSQKIANLFRPRLTWAIASMLLLVVSMFAIYFIVNRKNDEKQLAKNPPAKVQPAIKEHANSRPQGDKRATPSPSEKTGGKEQQLAGVPQHQRKRSRDTRRINSVDANSLEEMSTVNDVAPQPSSLPEPMMLPHRDSAALSKTLRVEIQTKDPNIRIIWFVQQETKPVIPSSKGT